MGVSKKRNPTEPYSFSLEALELKKVTSKRKRFTRKICIKLRFGISYKGKTDTVAAPEIDISLVPDIVSGSRHFVLVTRNLCRSSVYDIL